MPLLSDDDSASSDEKWWTRRRSKRLLDDKKAQQEQQQPARRNTWGGSKPGKSANFKREREFFHQILMRDYFVEHPTYNAKFFRRRFRMRRELFLRIQGDLLGSHGDIFKQKRDALGLLGFSPEQKLTSALRMLAYGSCADSNDEYIRMGETTTLNYLQQFCQAIIEVEEYTRGAASTIEFQANRAEIMSSSSHYNLRDDLTEHLWKFKHGKL